MAYIVTVGSFIKASKNKFFKIWILASLSKGYEFNFQWLSPALSAGHISPFPSCSSPSSFVTGPVT